MNIILKKLKQVINQYKKRKRKKRLLQNAKTECFNLRYSMLNLCMQYTHQGLKEGRFLYRIKKASRKLSRREIHLKKLKQL